ncbi:hypothetical protein CSKR_104953 [Clonorchis sinensis]|uniref:Ragulator complex protein LAMTOR3 n=2 Tax=Clonorchis sinensis TaxID=79923 RepID=A0A8T1MZX9_CLOSI|nr:hypothetical protein CSKR_104953 [Clonorchis sinensis]
MSESPTDYLKRFLSDVDGIIGLYVSDKDGVIMASVSSEDMPDQAIQPYVATTFLSSIQQSSKLEMGALEWMVTRYEYMVICQFNYATARPPLPLFLTIVGSNNCDLGVILATEPSIRPLLTRLAAHVSSRLAAEDALRSNTDGQFFRV